MTDETCLLNEDRGVRCNTGSVGGAIMFVFYGLLEPTIRSKVPGLDASE